MKAQKIYGRLKSKANQDVYLGTVAHYASGDKPVKGEELIGIRNPGRFYVFGEDWYYTASLDTNTGEYVFDNVVIGW